MVTKKECTDKNCATHGNLNARGRSFKGTVVSSKAQKTAIVMWERRVYISKYQRYEIRRSRVAVHNPQCINAQKGDVVNIKECRKLSKTKTFVIIQKVGENISFLEQETEKALEKESMQQEQQKEQKKMSEEKK